MKYKNLQSGYALLTAVILTATLVLVAYAVANVALRQLTLTTTNVESHNAFYIADSGLECAMFWDIKNPNNASRSAFDPISPAASITCGGATNTVTTSVSGGGGPATNYALTGTVTSSGAYSANFPASAVINGDKRGTGWATGTGGWNDDTIDNWTNDWVAIAFPTARNIDEIDVYTLANGFPLASDPGPSDTFSLYGITSFAVQYSTNNGGSWTTVPGGNITGNNLIWRKITFTSIPDVTNVRVLVTGSLSNYSRIVEIEAWGGAGGDSSVSNFQIPVGTSCAIVSVTKSADSMTTIESKGYNTCTGQPRFERAIRITY